MIRQAKRDVSASPPAGYYFNRHVRDRIYEFLGGGHGGEATAKFIRADGADGRKSGALPLRDLIACLEQGKEISRSLWDRDALLAHLDIEYVNFDFPGEAYLRPHRAFALQAPVVHAILRLLSEYDIFPLHILSGRGHHFVWQISQHSRAFQNLREIGAEYPSAQSRSQREVEANREVPSTSLKEAFMGLSLVMEFLAGEIKKRSTPLCPIPVELTAVEVGPRECGREMVSIDISEYGDPLESRATRVPFSLYLKPWQQQELIGREYVEKMPPMYFIPLVDIDVRRGIRIMRDSALTQQYAAKVSTKIPTQDQGMQKLVASYLASPLHHAHEWFYSHRQHHPDDWPTTYDLLSLDALPSCAREVLLKPNDLLLRPFGMRLIVRVLLASGWHPRHIAGLIRSKFERDYQWGTQWRGYDPAMRADFYTRIFTGLFAVWDDDLVDFNCQSFKEETTCPDSGCQNNLEWFRQSILSRRRYGQLAHRPFNRLFLPTQHF